MLSAKLAGAPVRADQQCVLPSVRGTPWWGAVLIAVVISGLGTVVGQLGPWFSVMFVIGCVVAVLSVRRRALFTAVAQPPLVAFGVAMIYEYAESSASSNGLKGLIINVLLPIAKLFPLMAWTFVVVAGLGAARWYLSRDTTTEREAAGTTIAGGTRGTRSASTRNQAPATRRRDDHRGSRHRERGTATRRSTPASSRISSAEPQTRERDRPDSRSSRGSATPVSARTTARGTGSQRRPGTAPPHLSTPLTAAEKLRRGGNLGDTTRSAGSRGTPTRDAAPSERVAGQWRPHSDDRHSGDRHSGDRHSGDRHSGNPQGGNRDYDDRDYDDHRYGNTGSRRWNSPDDTRPGQGQPANTTRSAQQKTARQTPAPRDDSLYGRMPRDASARRRERSPSDPETPRTQTDAWSPPPMPGVRYRNS